MPRVTTASISGFVLDPSGKPIPNAKVTVSDPNHALSRSAVTDTAGYYRVLNLAPALYTVSGEAAQFSAMQAPAIQ